MANEMDYDVYKFLVTREEKIKGGMRRGFMMALEEVGMEVPEERD